MLLEIQASPVSDLSPLSGLTKLFRLGVDACQVTDVSALAGLDHLNELSLRFNRIEDIGPLMGLQVRALLLNGNPLNEESLNAHVPALRGRGVRSASAPPRRQR